MTRDPHTPIVRNCDCVVEAGIVVAGPDAELMVAAFEAEHGHGPGGCGGELVHRAESSIGRKAKPKRGGRAA